MAHKNSPLELRLRVLSAIDYAPLSIYLAHHQHLVIPL